jgi:carbamoyltransferase
VGFHWDPLHQFHKRIAMTLRNLIHLPAVCRSHASKWFDILRVRSTFRDQIAGRGTKPSYSFISVRHHTSHGASAFLLSPFQKAAILTLDGTGEMASTTLAFGADARIETIKEIYYPHSFGYLFASLTHYLGFLPECDEYKLMSLASYGNDRFQEQFKTIIKLEPDGGFAVDPSYFNYQKGIRDPWVSAKFITAFGPPRRKGEPLEQRHKDLAWALQKRLEDAGLHMARHLHEATGLEDLCLAGGVALNAAMNGRLLRESPFKRIFVQPASNDAGCCLGSAYYIYHSILNQPRGFTLKHAYLGPGYTDEACRAALDQAGLRYQRYSEDELTRKTAELIAQGQVVGWFQGRMEMGPRALGNRSILADPRRADMKEVLNSKVKHREGFRPFAPSVLAEAAAEYFDCAADSPFMLFVFDVRKEKRDIIPAVTHVDGTARVQTVRAEENPRYWKLIKAFEKLTGVPVLLNTSFNVMGEPIVCSPADAVNCFHATGIDALVLGNHIVSKTTAAAAHES